MTKDEYNELLNEYTQGQVSHALYNIKHGLVRYVKWGAVALLVLTISGMAGCPPYNVWQQGLRGTAELKRAEQNRQIRIQEATAVKESSVFLAAAEVIRAGGVKDANDIIAEGLGGPEGYLRYLFINGLNSPDSSCETIYVPTEANIPILEVGRRYEDD